MTQALDKPRTADRYEVAVYVNNHEVEKLVVERKSGQRVIEVPADFLDYAPGRTKQTIRFELAGRGEFTYHIAFGGFVPYDKLNSTTDHWRVERQYEPAPLETNGRQIERGFGIVEGRYQTFSNPLTQLPVGSKASVRLRIHRQNEGWNRPDNQLDYLVVTEPLPSGTAVVEDSIRGEFERYELGAGEITFFIGNRRRVGDIHYDLHGYVPGEYRCGPSIVSDAYFPGDLAVATVKSLEVLPAGEPSSDVYRLTPVEQFEFGKAFYDDQDWKQTAEHLSALLSEWSVNANTHREAVRMLLDAYLELGPPHKIVETFEVMKEKWPDLEIPFAKIVTIGSAYHEMGEYERSYMVFRATVQAQFMRDVRVAGFLDEQQEFLQSVELMSEILRQYPPEGYVASASYALAQQVSEKAATAASDARLRAQQVTRVTLIRRALAMLQTFLTAYPEDPAADEAALSLAGALLELEKYDTAIEACRRFVARYPESEYLDSYYFTIGFCHFALGHQDEALATCRKVAQMERRDPATGQLVEATNRWQAVYILGQIYHSLGKAADAIAEYRRVSDRFPDAEQAIEYFTRRNIELPEVVTIRPGEPAEIPLAHRNIATCDVRIYRIDLMTFSLLKRNLENIQQINLAGIRPTAEETIELGDGRDYADRETNLKLPLDDEGAYLVVCRGDDLHTSGLVLVSPLRLEVQEDAVSGRVRVTVKDATNNAFVPQVQLKVIGSGNDEFKSGESDLRGVFVADDVSGTSTVIAESGTGLYAFHRGQQVLRPQDEADDKKQEDNGQAGEQQQAGQSTPALQGGKQILLKNIESSNSFNYRAGAEQLQQLYDNRVKGVEVQQAR